MGKMNRMAKELLVYYDHTTDRSLFYTSCFNVFR